MPTPDWHEQHGRQGGRSCGGGHLAGNHLTAHWVTRSSAGSAARSFFACTNPGLWEHNHRVTISNHKERKKTASDRIRMPCSTQNVLILPQTTTY
eukprot:1517052-Rhodomonas_salina.1